jgi:hypothetical protein
MGTLIRDFSGAIDEKALEAAISSSKSASTHCDSYFYGIWYFSLTGDPLLASRFSDRLSGVESHVCATKVAFASRLRSQGKRIRQPAAHEEPDTRHQK